MTKENENFVKEVISWLT